MTPISAYHPADEALDLSIIDNRVPDVARLFLNRVQASPGSEAYRFVRDGEWTSVTWAETGAQAQRLAAGLIELGVRPGDRVALAAGTRYEWIVADLAVMLAGAATTTVYPSTTAADVAFIVADSGSRVVVAEDPGQLAKLQAHRSQLPDVLRVVLIEGASDSDWVITLDELAGLGGDLLARQPAAVTDRVAVITPDSLATLIYTSGTTGRPKGVRLRHSAWTYEAAAVAAFGDLSSADLQYLWLPLAHVFGKMLVVLPLQIGFATAVDGRVDKIVENLAVVQPTFMAAAPRVFEKVYARVTASVQAEGGAKARIFDWAIGVGAKVAAKKRRHQPVPPLLAVQHAVADRLVLSKIRQRFGGRMRSFNSGSAALNREIAEWFAAIGVPILEGYGLTETSAGSFCNRKENEEYGTVGWPFPGTEVRIAEDGEILLRGPGVMEGYHNLPEETAAALTPDGWFHTGDIGELTSTGHLRITDRKKDLFKTSGGKYVAPAAIEALFKGICPYASQLVVFGDGHNFVTALITLDAEVISSWAAGHGMAGSSYRDIVTSPVTRELVQGYVDELNSRLNRWETIKKFVILERDLTVADGELTPSLKLRRRAVSEKFRDRLEALYD